MQTDSQLNKMQEIISSEISTEPINLIRKEINKHLLRAS